MDAIRYIHAADLHLETPFAGIAKRGSPDPVLKNLLIASTFRALDRLVDLCIAEKPDFLVLAGDVYNQEASLPAQLKLYSAFRRLEKANIQVFMVHGNHDPLSSSLATLEWPKNVHIFGAGPEKIPLVKNDKIIAIIHGASHETNRVSDNLAKKYGRDLEHDCFQMGILHCALEGSDVHDRYAPCSLEDLRASGLDAWALGHVHQKNLYGKNPFILYPGNTQGLHVNETGERGCYLVSVSQDNENAEKPWKFQEKFFRLGDLIWERINIDLSGAENLPEAQEILSQTLEEFRSKLHPSLTGAILRIELSGASALDSKLRAVENLSFLEESLTPFSEGHPRIWIKDIIVNTHSPASDLDLLERDDLLGEVTRIGSELAKNPNALNNLVREAINPDSVRPKPAVMLPEIPDELLPELVEDAKKICQRLLENH